MTTLTIDVVLIPMVGIGSVTCLSLTLSVTTIDSGETCD